jgi:hypothetical protein
MEKSLKEKEQGAAKRDVVDGPAAGDHQRVR